MSRTCRNGIDGGAITCSWTPTWLERYVAFDSDDKKSMYLRREGCDAEQLFCLTGSKTPGPNECRKGRPHQAAALAEQWLQDGLVVIYSHQRRYIDQLLRFTRRRTIERMQIKTVEWLGEPVGRLWMDRQSQCIERTGSFAVAAPLSSTPLPIYKWIVNNAGSLSWLNVEFVLMDEQVDGVDDTHQYVAIEDPASYEGFARRHFLDPLEQAVSTAIRVVKPDANRTEGFETRLNLLVLALGIDGNYANVMPGTPIDAGWHIAELLPAFREAHTSPDSKSYAGAKFRTHGMSLGPKQVIGADEVVVIASGAKKRELARRLLEFNSFDPAFPLSVIHHPDVEGKTTVYFTSDVLG